MSIENSPVIGNWYRRSDRPQPFHVVAFDPVADSIDVEYFDGTVDEWPLSHWYLLDLEVCEAPQDWTGPFDNIERDDIGESESATGPEDWQDALPEPAATMDLGAFEEPSSLLRSAGRKPGGGGQAKTRR